MTTLRRASAMDSANLATNLSSVYDGHGQRVVSTVAGESHTYVYNWMGEVIAEYGAQGWERDRIHRGGQLLATDEAVGTCRKTIEQFVVSFYRGALNRAPSTAEYEEWRTRLQSAQAGGQEQLLAQARVFGRTLFESEEYAARQRTDAEFVSDMYWSYLQRAADQDGSLFWRAEVQRGGRSHGLNSFAQSIEYRATVEGLCEAGAVTGEVQWMLADHLGSVRVITNSAGEVIARRDNLPFGDALRDVGAAAARPEQASASESTSGLWGWHNAIRTLFAGMEKDASTGLEHTQWRKYDAWQGRWTSADPSLSSMNMANPQSFNRYSYVHNDPVNMVDPTGLDGITIDTGAPVTVIGYVDSAVRGGVVTSLAGLVGVDGGREWNELLTELGGGESGGGIPQLSDVQRIRQLDDIKMTIGEGFRGAIASLEAGKNCRDFFMRSGYTLNALVDLLEALRKTVKHDPRIAELARTSGTGRDARISVGDDYISNTATYKYDPKSGKYLDVEGFGLERHQYRASTILHEFAHALGIIPRDGRGSPAGQSEKNHETILKHCGSVLKRLR